MFIRKRTWRRPRRVIADWTCCISRVWLNDLGTNPRAVQLPDECRFVSVTNRGFSPLSAVVGQSPVSITPGKSRLLPAPADGPRVLTFAMDSPHRGSVSVDFMRHRPGEGATSPLRKTVG